MHVKNKKKLGIALVLFTLLLLIAGTFAFTAFNQRAINDRLRDNLGEVGGRVHDYYNRDTENKDVFVENYGEESIMARIRLSEFMEIRRRGETSFTPVVPNTERDAIETWTTYIPEGNTLTTRVGDSAVFNQYSNLTFGWTRQGEHAPWYLPTFNHVENDLMTAAAGHARDYIAGTGATDGSTDGATHPGTGEDAYWQEGESYTNGQGPTSTVWPGALEGVERTTAQNLPQDRAPLTLQQWAALPNEHKIGDFWVIDHETGWAYWASQLQEGETSSYLLDAAVMTEAAHDIRGSYYYAIHVDSQLITPDRNFENEPEEGHDGNLGRLLQGIRNNAVEDSGQNPGANVDSPVDAFNFSTMNPGRIFTMANEQYRYLEDMGGGNHLIIRNDAIRNVSWNNQEIELTSWYGQLDPSVQAIVQPVANEFTTGEVSDDSVTFTGGTRWIPDNLEGDVAADITQVVPGGTQRAFALSLADVARLSGGGLAFSNHAQRAGTNNSWWWLRTFGVSGRAWRVVGGTGVGQLSASNDVGSGSAVDLSSDGGGIRPALIIHQSTT
ncbi:hypothetical protein [Lactococcus ileimucosae]|uniref:hypothetical protein n=1 Tax=Lactococcus ileimucosae TaxID=2941329 RepID=UPI002043C72E|nr:hypothetical protein [Lactococcus ileimucosae]